MKKVIILMSLCVGLLTTGCGSSQGLQGQQGAVGDTGSTGPKGDTGAQGPAGADGTLITIVQFCPNSVPVYPSVFPEIGECINGKLYAVYSANGGFLALIPPGGYSSAGIGSNCNFIVLPNCVISH